MNQEAAMQGLPTLDQLDQTCYYVREMLNVQHSDEDLFIRDNKKGTK